MLKLVPALGDVIFISHNNGTQTGNEICNMNSMEWEVCLRNSLLIIFFALALIGILFNDCHVVD